MSAEEGQKVRAAAGKLVPDRPPEWQPQANERVMYKRPASGAWELFDALRDPPVYKDRLRELWQPKTESILDGPFVKDIYPFPAAAERTRIEPGSYAACIIVDARFENNRGTRLCRVEKRANDMLHVTDEDGRAFRIHSSDCIHLGAGMP